MSTSVFRGDYRTSKSLVAILVNLSNRSSYFVSRIPIEYNDNNLFSSLWFVIIFILSGYCRVVLVIAILSELSWNSIIPISHNHIKLNKFPIIMMNSELLHLIICDLKRSLYTSMYSECIMICILKIAITYNDLFFVAQLKRICSNKCKDINA